MNKVKTVLSLAAVMALALPMSAYASNPSAAKTNVQQPAAKNADSIAQEIAKLTEKLPSGNILAYYVPDKKSNPADKIAFASKGYVYDNYAKYADKMNGIEAPSLEKPGYMSKGYAFKSGILYAALPDQDSDLYQKLDKELRTQAGKGGKKVYTKQIPVDSAMSSVLNFENNKKQISLVATFIAPPPAGSVPGTPVPYVNPKTTTEEITINDVKCVYTADPTSKSALKYSLAWTDEDANVKYTIWTDQAGTKNELVAIATSMLK